MCKKRREGRKGVGRPREIALPVLGKKKPYQVSLIAGRQALSEEDRLVLLEWKRSRSSARRALWYAAVDGLAETIRRTYAARWASAHNRPVVAWRDYGGNADALCKKGATWLLEYGFTVERLFDVAEDYYRRPGHLRYPPLRNVVGPAVLSMVPEWIPPGEREDRAAVKEADENTRKLLESRRGQTHIWLRLPWPSMGRARREYLARGCKRREVDESDGDTL